MTKDIVMLVGPPAGGKSTVAQEFIDDGYEYINRDKRGGSIKELVPLLVALLRGNRTKVVIDNTHPTRIVRALFVDVAKQFACPIRCIHLNTPLEEAQFNSARRMIKRFGHLLMPEEIKKKADPNTFPVSVLFKFRKELEIPLEDEGFVSVTTRNYTRMPLGPEYVNKAILLDYDDTLRETKSNKKWPHDPNDIQILPRRREVLESWQKKGFVLLGVSNQSGCARNQPTIAMAEKCFIKTNTLLGVDIDFMFCPHKIPPVICYCRKPASGIGAAFIEKYKLNPAECIMVGDSTSDKTFATRCGFQFQHPDIFFRD